MSSAIRTLIVEDDIKIAEINSRFLSKVEGYEACGISTNLEEAKEMLDILQPDLVLLDVYFPDGSGIDLLWYIRHHFRSTDVIMITAAKEVDHVEEAIRGGAIDYLIKPIIFGRFVETLEKYKQYKNQIQSVNDLNQETVDSLFQTVRKTTHKGSAPEAPKGIDPLTLHKIKNELIQLKRGTTAEEIGQQIGASRTTARRYLEYLVSTGEVHAELSYGTVGRPERQYYAAT